MNKTALTVGTARYIIKTQDMARDSRKSEIAPAEIPPTEVRKSTNKFTCKFSVSIGKPCITL